MTRATVFIAILLVSLNGMAFAVSASGTGNALGIAPQPGGQGEVGQVDSEGDVDVDASSTFGETSGALGIVIGLFDFFDPTDGVITNLVFAGPKMFLALGLPSWVTDWLFGPLYLVVLADAVYLLVARQV